MRTWINLLENVEEAEFNGHGYVFVTDLDRASPKPTWLCCAPANTLSYAGRSATGYLCKYRINATNPLRVVGHSSAAYMNAAEIKATFGLDDGQCKELIQDGIDECGWEIEDENETFCVSDFISFTVITETALRKGHDALIYFDDGDHSAESENVIVLDPSRVSFLDSRRVEKGEIVAMNKTGPLF